MELRPWQPEAVEFGLTAQRWVLSDPPGAGKTITALAWLRQAGARRTLIVVPNAVVGQWLDQAKAWAPDHITIVGVGTPKERTRSQVLFEEAAFLRAGSRGVILITTYDLVRRDYDALVRLRFDTLIADEAHRLKDRRALQSRQVTKLARRAERVCFATGTPVINEAEELWSYLHMLDPKGYPSFWTWARRHFEILLPTYGFTLHPIMEVGPMLPGHADLIREECRGRVFVRTPADIWPDKAPPVETIVEVELSPEERQAYTALTKRHWMQLGGEVVTTSNAVARTTRARQLASDWRNLAPELPAGAKVQAAIRLAEWLARPTVTLTAFRGTAERVAEAVGGSLYLGGTSSRRRDAAVAAFRTGQAGHFVGTLGAVGEGLDGLQHVASDLILVDREWAPARNQQVIGRLDREGQPSPEVRVWHIVARDTVDDVVAKALATKTQTVAALDLASLR